ncbi:MAG: oxidoreductase [Naasia sp.]|uniref:molybdopterin-dependent oxidoreductase n=1 Tax=Naasia sp. TaxID=2546198 RepID=UPI002613F574|nr:molybdopterin-dependent oxidoreductase [Naasia sp.]MCU1571897.1 oxidoreductase [Naasia sp.]
MRRFPWGPITGIAAGVVGLGAGELLAGILGTSPVGAVSSAVIDFTPGWLKEAVIAVAGTADKVVLVVSLLVVAAAIAIGAGILEVRRPPWGAVLLGALGALAVIAALSRSSATEIAAVPSVGGTVAALLVLRGLGQRARTARAIVPARDSRGGSAPATRAAGPSRRSFLISAGIAAAVGVAAAVGSQALALGTRAVDGARRAIRLPAPSKSAPPIPAGASLEVEGIAPLITPNADFYRIDTAVFLPNLDPAEWKLRIFGMVEQEVEIGYQELLALPLEESHATLTCVSNVVGGDLISTATWLGYPIRSLLARARPSANADMVLSKSSDGFTAGTPITALTDERNAILAVGMNGVPLPREHGFPVRMVVPGLYGYVSATKWLVSMEVTRFDRVQAYWTQRAWGERGPVKLSSRIDVPKDGARVAEGTVTVAGVAWEQHTGVAGVQVSVDGGEWQDADIATELTVDTWRQWRWDWAATPGSHELRARATDATGAVQDPVERGVLPDGATGFHTITVDV